MQWKLPKNLNEDIDLLETKIRAYKQKALSVEELKAFRVPLGIYEQRVSGLYMVRVRCPGGILSPFRLRAVAQIAKESGSGRLHVTTRQELQLHDIPLDKLIVTLRKLLEVDLCTKGGGGNTVRNITASWDSGISQEEAFDVTPHALELTSRLAALPNSWMLPRKFKIAFSNSPSDNAGAAVNDLGFIAEKRGDLRGFRVFVAGGMGRSPQTGSVLHDFIEETKTFEIAEAVKRLFSKYGNRRNKNISRLRFLWNRFGEEKFVALYNQEREALSCENPDLFDISGFVTNRLNGSLVTSGRPIDLNANNSENDNNFQIWKKRFCDRQPMSDLYYAVIALTLGDITADTAKRLADFLEPFGNDVLRFTLEQNVVLRNIPSFALLSLYDLVTELFPNSYHAKVISRMSACAGASTCRLGLCLSRGALEASAKELTNSSVSLDLVDDVQISFSGCSNSCGRHSIADIGFYGKVAKKDNRLYPVYGVTAGAVIKEESSTLAEKIGNIPARNVPLFLKETLAHYADNKENFSSFRKYLEDIGFDKIRIVLNSLHDIPSYDEDPKYYYDWGTDKPFSAEGRGKGECSSGLYDLIDLDLQKVSAARIELDKADTKETGNILRKILFYSAKALLITQTTFSPKDEEIPVLFIEHFIDKGLVPADTKRLVRYLENPNDNYITEHAEEIIGFADTIIGLYASLNETMQFIPNENTCVVSSTSIPILEMDLRGVKCPMNFVKTQNALFQIKKGDTLRILLDDGEPKENVVSSVQAEGHKILGKMAQKDFWEIIIRRS